jgi:SAM-dependent methyltransferase
VLREFQVNQSATRRIHDVRRIASTPERDERTGSGIMNRFLRRATHRLRSKLLTFLIPDGRQPIRGFQARLGGEVPSAKIEAWHETSRGLRLPVHESYRWSIKPGWRSFPALNGLVYLDGAKLLSPAETAFFKSSIGPRTLARFEAEIDDFAAPIFARHAAFFIPNAKGRVPQLIAESAPAIVESTMRHHAFGLNLASEAGISVSGSRALEIGFNEGYSPIALAKMGFEVHCVDNSYGLDDAPPAEIGFVAAKFGVDIAARFGDAAKQLPFPDSHFDYVYSASVLEHIHDIEAALREIRRVLKPDGVAIHSFGSFHCCDGAHALAIPDQPWGHSRMTADEYAAYITHWRPFEANRALPWLEHAISRRSIAATESAIARAGMGIVYWQETPSPDSHLRHLTPEIAREALAANPGISLADLCIRDVYFVAKSV